MLKHRNILVAITGGSGSGKTYLASRLKNAFGSMAASISLDDFYLDRSKTAPSRRARLNFDHPRAVDWERAEAVLRQCRHGSPIELPRYDFKTHVRRIVGETWVPTPLIVWDGLWLISRPSMRSLFDLKIFLECPTQLRLERRLSRDVAERGRTAGSVREQFWKTVIPMHVRHVAPQAAMADIILQQPSGETEVAELIEVVRGLLINAAAIHATAMEPAPARVPPAAHERPSCRMASARSLSPANPSLEIL